MDKIIGYNEDELKNNIQWIRVYAKYILQTCDSINGKEEPDNRKIARIKVKANQIVKQLEDFKVST
jgi:hypothetical protein